MRTPESEAWGGINGWLSTFSRRASNGRRDESRISDRWRAASWWDVQASWAQLDDGDPMDRLPCWRSSQETPGFYASCIASRTAASANRCIGSMTDGSATS